MIGAIIGDVVGSRFERNNIKSKDFELFTSDCRFTDDTVMTLAVFEAIKDYKNNTEDEIRKYAINNMVELGNKYPYAGYGKKFRLWLKDKEHKPYGSYGNGAAMRVSACGYVADSLEDAIKLSTIVTNVSHNHEYSVSSANMIAAIIFLFRNGCSKEKVKEYVNKCYTELNFTLDEIRDTYHFDSSCQGSVPQALEAFFEANNFEETIRNAVSIGGDSDTIAAIAGSIAASFYEVPENMKESALSYLTKDLLNIYKEFDKKESKCLIKKQ